MAQLEKLLEAEEAYVSELTNLSVEEYTQKIEGLQRKVRFDEKPAFERAVARTVPTLEISQAARIVKGSRYFELVFENPNLDDKDYNLLLRYIADDAGNFTKRGSFNSRLEAAGKLKELASRGIFLIHDEVGKWILARLEEEPDEMSMYDRDIIITAMLEAADMDEETLVEIARLSKKGVGQKNMARQIAEHPKASPRVWKLLFESKWCHELIEALSQAGRLRNHPDFRPTLVLFAKTQSLETLKALLSDERKTEFRELWRGTIDRCNEGEIVEILNSCSSEQLSMVEPEELAPLLSSKDREVRIAAAGAVRGELQEQSSPWRRTERNKDSRRSNSI